MSKTLAAFLVVMAIVGFWSLLRKVLQDYEERERVSHQRELWAAKRYADFFKEVSVRQDLNKVVSSQEFLSAGYNMPVGDFLSALVQYDFIEITRQKYAQAGYSSFSRYALPQVSIQCSSDVPPVLEKLLDKAVKSSNVVNVLLLYYALFSVDKNSQASSSLNSAAAFIRNCGFRIYHPVISKQCRIWHKIIFSEYDEQNFSEAERRLFQIEGKLSREDFLSTSKSAIGPYDEVQLQGHALRFYSVSHTYFVDGIRVLSVTQMLKEVDLTYGNYAGVSPEVLNRAAARGTALHAEIQNYEEQGILGATHEFYNYLNLKERYGFRVDTCEQYVLICYKNIPVCAGRFDLMITTSQGKPAMADIKRTSTYKKGDVTKQLNLYRLGYIQTYGGQIEEAYCLRLREEIAQFRPVDVDEELAENLVERYVTKLQNRAKSYYDLLQG